MNRALRITLLIVCAVLSYALTTPVIYAQQTIDLNASKLIPKVELSFSPTSGSFAQGSTFDVPLYIDTKGASVSAIELHISFDPEILSVIKPAGGTSVVGLWIEPPTYDNTKGTITFIGGVPRGITTNSGLISQITFQAKNIGTAQINILPTSRVLINDGAGSPAIFTSNSPRYSITTKPPGTMEISSETHPFSGRWYNNNNPVFTWKPETGSTAYSFILDNKPLTVPDNTVDGESETQSYEGVNDGISYFHVKARKGNVWGAPSHFEIKIDSTPPAEFKPEINYITAAVINRALVSFFTTDNLSGVDYYEVGTIDKSKPASESPAFVRTESPYQLPLDMVENARLIVRAFDKAGNVRDSSIDVSAPFLPYKFIKDHAVAILIIIVLLLIIGWILHYFFGHHIIRHAKAIWKVITNKKELEKIEREDNHDGNIGTPGL